MSMKDQSRVRMAPVQKVMRWKTRRVFQMAPHHHVFLQKREAQPIWIDNFVLQRR